MKLIPGQTPTRLALFGAVLIGSTFCPQILAGTAAPAIVGTLAGMVSSVFGGLVANDMGELAKRLENKDTTNHDLAKATGEAIGLVLSNLAETKDLDAEFKQKLKQLAEVAENQWLEISQPTEDEDVSLEIPETELVKLMSRKAEDFAQVTAFDRETWEEVVVALAAAANTQLKNRWISIVAIRLRSTFPQAFREVLKLDAERGGKAYAAMSLNLMGEITALASQRAGFPEDDIISIETYLEENVKGKIEKQQRTFCQLIREVESGFTVVIEQAKQEIIDEIRAGFQGVNTRLEEIGEDVEEIKDIISQRKLTGGALIGGSFSGICANWQGRELEIQQLKDWIQNPDITLMGIEGTGGIGKTSLAAKVFEELNADYRGYWADVSAGAIFTEVARAVLAHFQYPIPESETALPGTLVSCLQQTKCLLVFDNLETVLRDGQFVSGSFYDEFFRGWLNRRSDSAVVVTTRERSNLRGFNYWLPPLTGLSETEGAAFLKGRGLTDDEAKLREFSRLVDGYPLLLRLVADLLVDDSPQNPRLERLNQLGLASLPELLTHPDVKGTHRQAEVGIVAVLDASYRRLSDEAKTLLHSASVLRGEFEAEMALAVSGLEKPPREVAADLRQLARQSWLLEDEVKGARVYDFQQVVLAYVQHKAGNLTAAHQRAIVDYQSRVKLRGDWESLDDVSEYLEIFYHYCQLGAYESAFDTLRDGDDVNRFLDLRGYNSTRMELYSQLVENWPEVDRQNWKFGAALTSLGNAYYSLGQFQRSIEFHQQYLDISREIGYRQGEANSLGNLGNAYYSLGQFQRSIEFHQQSLDISREIGYRQGEAISLGNLGAAYYSLGQFQRSIEFHQQYLDISREIGYRQGEAISLGNLGAAYYSLGQFQRSIEFHQQQLVISREIGDRQGEAISLGSLGAAYYSLGQFQRSIEFHQQSLDIKREIGDRQGEANSLGSLGNAYYSLGQFQRSIEFYQQSLDISREIGYRQSEATSLQNLARAYHLTGRVKEGYQAGYQAQQILQELNLPLEAYPIPKWQKSIARFAQKGKAQFAICFILGILGLRSLR
ncbi:tetratricopeptide repeat protein [Baaleninema simplex]|uniref:tetratricopeptide repeat protein n=1 Tax=Baaleninema simplex TaxID=2862350 RepID=UPI000344F0EA|nr:tetratricopeptide repeat protein [Baaleninema simplex]